MRVDRQCLGAEPAGLFDLAQLHRCLREVEADHRLVDRGAPRAGGGVEQGERAPQGLLDPSRLLGDTLGDHDGDTLGDDIRLVSPDMKAPVATSLAMGAGS
jgi:hypothetical protein